MENVVITSPIMTKWNFLSNKEPFSIKKTSKGQPRSFRIYLNHSVTILTNFKQLVTIHPFDQIRTKEDQQ